MMQGHKIKASGLKKSYKSLKTAADLRPSLSNFFAGPSANFTVATTSQDRSAASL
jgi:hypothetical protein